MKKASNALMLVIDYYDISHQWKSSFSHLIHEKQNGEKGGKEFICYQKLKAMKISENFKLI